MVPHYYTEGDQPPISLAHQRIRLTPALAITRACIPCVIWAEDALAFVHRVPTMLFTLQLLVPDDSLSQARDAVLSTHLFDHASLNEHEALKEWEDIHPEAPHAYPQSIYLRTKPTTNESMPEQHFEQLRQFHSTNLRDVLIHPASYFDFSIHDSTRTIGHCPPLDSLFNDIKFPTVSAFLDGLSSVYLRPPDGYPHSKRADELLNFIGYLMLYTLSDRGKHFHTSKDGTQELLPSFQKVLQEVNAPNKRFIERLCLGLPPFDSDGPKEKDLKILS